MNSDDLEQAAYAVKRRHTMRASVLCEAAGRALWSGDALKAEHALREALQIVETLKEVQTLKEGQADGQ